MTSAAGRLFDAVAALLGVRHHVTYEAQAAIELEMLATEWRAARPLAELPPAYPFEIETVEPRAVVRLARLLQAILEDREAGLDPGAIGWRFHRTLGEMLVSTCRLLAAETDLHTVALSGGCFQNRLLLALSVFLLKEAGFRVLLHRQVPCNDGGVSLGQVALARFASPDGGHAHEVY